MQRIPNPGSDLSIFIRIFQELHELLKDRTDFDLDDMTKAMIQRNNVSSQGAFGAEALQRSTRKDRSRDPLYNQSKMYAELFRTLGWLQSTTSSLRFAFSWVGEHVATAKNPKALVVECLIGMAYPNDVLGVQGEQSIRIFGAILSSMAALDGRLSRDEMIVGPLSLTNDRSHTAVKLMVDLIRDCRSKRGSIIDVINELSGARNISYTTMGNYTRFPIAAIQWAGWAVKVKGSFTLTDLGRAKVEQLKGMQDVRLSDYKALNDIYKPAFIRYSAYKMLERAGFDLSEAAEFMNADSSILKTANIISSKEVIFSPFQQIGRSEVNAAFPHLSNQVDNVEPASIGCLDDSMDQMCRKQITKAKVIFELTDDAFIENDETDLLTTEIQTFYVQSGGDVELTIKAIMAHYSTANQDLFYPLVAALFRIIGFACETSRRGVNYARADAMIFHPDGCIPIEIKSPGEEAEISVKGVRQALENKIILLSRARKGFLGVPETTSLVVGFNPPNDRSEVHELIEDIYTTFQISVGVIDFRSLLRLGVAVVITGKQVVLTEFRTMKGVIHVERISPAN
jgi:hypothetical protein